MLANLHGSEELFENEQEQNVDIKKYNKKLTMKR